MRGISKKKLPELLGKIADQSDNDGNINYLMLRKLLLNECQEPWITLDEFLKSGFEGMCWVCSVYKDIFVVQFIDDNFISINTGAKAQLKYIERVMPIHKPEPPR